MEITRGKQQHPADDLESFERPIDVVTNRNRCVESKHSNLDLAIGEGSGTMPPGVWNTFGVVGKRAVTRALGEQIRQHQPLAINPAKVGSAFYSIVPERLVSIIRLS